MRVTTQSWNESVVRQFPGLGAAMTRGDGSPLIPHLSERIAIARVDPNLLEIEPSEEQGSDLSGWSTQDRVEFWSENWTHLGTVKAAFSDLMEPRHSRGGESVGDALAAISASLILPEPLPLAFITRYQNSTAAALTIYKLGDFNLTAWRAEREAAADRALAAKLAGATRWEIRAMTTYGWHFQQAGLQWQAGPRLWNGQSGPSARTTYVDFVECDLSRLEEVTAGMDVEIYRSGEHAASRHGTIWETHEVAAA